MTSLTAEQSVVEQQTNRQVAKTPMAASLTLNPSQSTRGTNHYQLLQVKPYAGDTKVRCAYRQLALNAHPDVNRAHDATQQMQALNEAYAVLRDPARRAAYDRARFAAALAHAFSGGPPISPPPPARRWYQRLVIGSKSGT